MKCRLCSKPAHRGPCYPAPNHEGTFGWGIKIMDETELKRIVVVGSRSYEVPKEVADEIEELRRMYNEKLEHNRKVFVGALDQALNEGNGAYKP